MSQVQAKGKCIDYVLTKQNEKKSIHNDLCVPHLKHNLISVGKLSKTGYDVRFRGT